MVTRTFVLLELLAHRAQTIGNVMHTHTKALALIRVMDIRMAQALITITLIQLVCTLKIPVLIRQS